MRNFLVAFFRTFLRLFYRRVEVLGLEHVPPGRGVVFAVNHPNGLVDPLFVLCFAPRSVSFLAKAPLFELPVIGWLARRVESIPVYRKQDEVAGSNRETFARARAILSRGGGIAIFPEGTTHSDPQLRLLKTGAARIALGAGADAARGAGGTVIVPAGIYYSAKQTFRSDALVVFGSPIEAAPAPLDPSGEPPAEAVQRLTEAIERGLDAVTLQADSRAALELIALAEDIFSAADAPRVSSEFTLRRRFVDGYHWMRERDPARLEAMASRIERFAAELGRARLEPHELVPRFRPATLLQVLVLLPVACAGAALHYPTYRLVGALASRVARGESEMMATMKFLGSLLLFPLTWLALAVAAGFRWGPPAAAGTLVTVPLLGYVALRVFEKLDAMAGALRAMTRRDRYGTLVAERDAIREAIVAAAEEMESAPSATVC